MAGARPDVAIALPLLPDPHPPEFTQRRVARRRRWRLWALVGLHILIAIHLAHWLIAGRSVGRFVLSDSMETLEAGRLNPGFLLFSAALIVTLLGGRWLCGWACHMGALQETCAWMMRRVGVRPRTFRVRLLGYVPFVLAVYMFIWPTLRRDVIAPAVAEVWPEAPAWLSATAPFPGFRGALVSDDLWQGLPGAAVAVPFLLVCGGLTVFFLGNRGFCRYGCPYGGIFRMAEPLAVGRVRVDLGSCDGCGRCTAACSSGVRVHEEVRAYGRVVSAGCVKTLDCIAACPRDALSFGPSTPALVRGAPREGPPRAVYDTTWGEEIAVLAVFAATFFASRGLYDAVPMLMAVGIGACAAALAWTAWRVVRRRDVRLAGVQLKRSGRLLKAGAAFLVIAAAAAMLLGQSAAVRLMQWRGGAHDDRVRVSRDEVFAARRPPLDPADEARARAALRWYGRAASWRDGGIGLGRTPGVDIRVAWLHLVLGDAAEAERALRRASARGDAPDWLRAELGRVILLRGASDEAREHLADALQRDDGASECRDLLARVLAGSGRIAEAQALYEQRLSRNPRDAACRASLGALLLFRGEVPGAREHLRSAIEHDPALIAPRLELARSFLYTGEPGEARRILEAGAEAIPSAAAMFRGHAEQLR